MITMQENHQGYSNIYGQGKKRNLVKQEKTYLKDLIDSLLAGYVGIKISKQHKPTKAYKHHQLFAKQQNFGLDQIGSFVKKALNMTCVIISVFDSGKSIVGKGENTG